MKRGHRDPNEGGRIPEGSVTRLEGAEAAVILTYRVLPDRRESFLTFLRKAFPIYETPGGIHMLLFESPDSPGLFVEVASYDTVADYDRDQVRVESDPVMLKTLKTFHSFADGPIDVKRVHRTEIIPRP